MIVARNGRVVAATSDTIVVSLPDARVGESVTVTARSGASVVATVTRVDRDAVRLAAYGPLDGIGSGDSVRAQSRRDQLNLGIEFLGRAIDAGGRTIDGRPTPRGRPSPISPAPIATSDRRPIAQPFWTGIRTIDGLLTLGRGARIGVFGAPGAGKSMLLEALVRSSNADAVVVGLIGERGREAAAWLERIERHATLVIVPSDRPAAERMRGANVAVAQACALRARGLSVLLLLDSLARFCAAARELAIASGEAVGRGGYPPSVFNSLARLVERAGNAGNGSITMVATVLSDGADEREPVSDAARSVLDGHIALSPALARQGHYPAIDVLASVSRTMNEVVSKDHASASRALRAALSKLDETRDARELGMQQRSLELDRILAIEPDLMSFLRQDAEASSSRETLDSLARLTERLRAS